jgi:NAD(P)H-dependent flavin oxidoreductase YrpB (nitropropane dioxygenase family)
MREQLFKTRMTELLGIRHPILCGGLMWLADGRYVAAACNAGAIGFITALSFPDPEEFREQIRLCRSLVGDKPFGINLSVSRRPGVNERIRKHIDVACEERVPVVETSGSSPEEILPRLKEAGSKVIHKVPHLKYARSVARQPIDGIIIVGGEAGGHPGVLLTSTMVQAGMAADELTLPWAIGGGIGAGRQLAAALAMGADAVLLGTRMLASREIWAHEDYKKRLVAGDGLDSVLRMQIFQDTHRVMRNDSSEAVAQLEALKVRNFESYRPHVEGSVARRAYETGDTRTGMLDYGQSVAYIRGIESVEEIIDSFIDDANAAQARLQSRLQSTYRRQP